uniref:Uncharacterized protein n=1 Tax=Arundo donax TaxID=35708 RepID=A0A0A9BBD1_ARUDO
MEHATFNILYSRLILMYRCGQKL